MRDLRSFTGVNSTQNIFAVSGNAEFILFKKSSKELYYFDPEVTDNNATLVLLVSDHLHAEDTIFDLFFFHEQLVVLLQNPIDNKIYFALCFIDLEIQTVVTTEIKEVSLPVKSKSGFSKLILDELGPVFISFPSTFESNDPKLRQIEIFHAGDFLDTGFNKVKRLPIEQRKLKNKSELWCDPFFSRGALYFFNQFDHQILVISALEEFSCRIVQTKAIENGPVPSRNFVHRNCIVYDEFAFVFFSQLMENGKKVIGESDCQAWKLYLNSMEWEPIDLFLSAHSPRTKVTMRCASNNPERIFIHGACNIPNCLEQFHLYELNLGCSTRLLEGIQYAEVFTEKSVDNPIKKKPSILQYVNVARELFSKNKNANNGKSHKLRKEARRRSNSQSQTPAPMSSTDRLSTHSMHSCVTTSSNSSNSSGMSWNRQMAFEPSIGSSPKLIEQLSLAKEMGFTENEIIQALEMKNQDKKSKIYNPFLDTSEMIDKLTMVQKCNNAPKSHDIPSRNLVSSRRSTGESDSSGSSNGNYRSKENNNLSSLKLPANWNSSTLSPRSASVSRSASFTNVPGYNPIARRPRSTYLLHSFGGSSTGLNNNSTNNSSLQRLIETFDNDRKTLFEEFGKELADMKMKLERYAREKKIAEDRLSSIEEENKKLESRLRDRDAMERKLIEMKTENIELKTIVQKKEEEIQDNQRHIESLTEIAEKAEELGEILRQKEEELERKCSELDSLEREVKLLSDPEKTIRELEDELVQLKIENNDYREKQATLSCTICLDQPRNVLYMPCLHFICCSSCVVNTDTCGICRTRIMGKVQVYQ